MHVYKPLPSPLWRRCLDGLTQRHYDQAAADLAKRDDGFWERWGSETKSLMATYGLSHEEGGYAALRRLEGGCVIDCAARYPRVVVVKVARDQSEEHP